MTDWCTGFPETWNSVDIAPCCQAHDLAYEVGAPKTGADVALASCIYGATGDGVIASIVLVAVAVCGVPFYLRAWLKRRRSDGLKRSS